jgi:DNA-binding SARP family transcriptional activator
LRIQTFGGLRAWLGDDPVALPPSRQSRALLACLASSSKPWHRSRLCELLWENASDPRGALRWCLSRLKPVLDAGGVARLGTGDDALWVEAGTCEVDGQRLRELSAGAAQAATAELEDAVARFNGPFLADLDLADSIRFESWRVAEEKSLAQARARVFEELLRRHADSPESKVRIGHVWVQQDPLDVRPHAAIIEALTALNRRREALAHYERSAQMLRRHGGEPGPALEKARAAIGALGRGEAPEKTAARNTQVSQAPGRAPAGAVPAPEPDRPAGAPLAGRGREMERFDRLAASPASDGKLRLLMGEPGIGKTRLLEEMGAHLSARGWKCLKGRAFEAERGRALGPWIDAARTLASEHPGLAGDGPLLRPAHLPERGQSDPSALFEAMREWLAGLAASAPLALLLDDIHWLDAASVALLQYLLRVTDRPFRLMFAGIRSVGAPQDAAVESLLRAARREGWTEEWEIGPLDAEDTAALLKQVGSKRDPREVFARSAGHPLASLALAWEGESAGPRASLESMLDERIRLAGEDGRSVLQWAALLGRGLPPALLETLLDLPVHALLSALERLEAEGLVRVVEGDAGQEYLFGHDLIRQRAQDTLSGPRRLSMHAHVARKLKDHPSLRRGWEEVAQHAEMGGQWELAAEACLEASHHCYRLRAFEAMEAWIERGLDHLERTGGHWALRREYCMVSNRVIHLLGRFPEGLEARLVRLMEAAKAQGQEETKLAALYALAVVRYVREDPKDLREGILMAGESEAGETDDPQSRAYNLAGMALCLMATDQEIPKARQLIGEAGRICAEHGIDEADTRMGMGWLAHRDGSLAEARAHLAKAAVMMRAKEHPQFEHQSLVSLSRLELEDEAPLEALVHIDRLRRLDEFVRHTGDRLFPAALASLAALQMGDADAEDRFRESLEALRAGNCKVMTAYLQLFRAERELRSGACAELSARCREAIERCEPLGRLAEPTWARCLLGLAALQEGKAADARTAWKALAPALPMRASLPARIAGLLEEFAAGLGESL